MEINKVILGDCAEVLKTFPDACVDSVVTDPPYGLGDHDPTAEEIKAYLEGAQSLGPLKKGRKHCANNVVRMAIVPNSDDVKTKGFEESITFRVVVPKLSVMSLRIVQLDDQVVREKKVNDVSPLVEFNDVLVNKLDSHLSQSMNDSQLCLRESQTFPGCIETCCCFTHLGESTFRILVRLRHNAFRESETSSQVLAFSGTEVKAVLTLDLRSRTGELSLANSTDPVDPGLTLTTPENIGALTRAGRLLSSLQVLLTGQVAYPTDGTIAFDVSLPAILVQRFHTPRVPQKDFMGKPWEIPSVAMWRECYRVLKPGGHVLCFAGTRTWDIMSIGLRAAGFDNRDTVSSLFGSPCLAFLHGMGFPKSTNISKKLLERAKDLKESNPEEMARLEQLAKKFEGYGTALKPSWEPILCFRKPLVEPSLTDQVITTGTGVLNIGGTRIQHSSPEDFENHKKQVERIKSEGGSWSGSWKNSSSLSGASDVTSAGRWPPNVTLTHSPQCTRASEGASYECIEGCPVKTLEAQSEGSSRFFGQFAPDAPFFYTGKASKQEKNRGMLQGKISNKRGERLFRLKEEALTPEELARFNAHWPQEGNDPKLTTNEALIPKQLLDLFVPAKPDENVHPTVKSEGLMAWLVGLVTPVGGLVLDPYCGSGTTCVAALSKECDYLGIEKDPMYHKIAERRLSKITENEISKRTVRSSLDAMFASIGSDED
jgi:site-specific DNA-methyltransferase (adenine-specific)